MSFRRASNAHDRWHNLVQANASLLGALPPDAVTSEAAFRDYATSGVHRGVVLAPAVSELPIEALCDLGTFIHHRAHFDMDVTLFDSFTRAFQRLHAPSSRPA